MYPVVGTGRYTSILQTIDLVVTTVVPYASEHYFLQTLF